MNTHLLTHLIGLGHTEESARECLALHRSDLVTTVEAARLLGVTPAAIHYHRKAGHVSPVKVGRDWLYTREQLDALATNPPRRTGRPKRERTS